MKLGTLTLFLCMFLALVSSYAFADVSAKLYYADGITPLGYPDISDIMVGTQLKIVISSTESFIDPYFGSLVLEDSNIPQAILSADFYGFPSVSILPAAGELAYIDREVDGNWYGLGKTVNGVLFEAINLSDVGPDQGDWFIVDYNAVELGNCEINLYRTFFAPPPSDPDPPQFLQTIQLKHVKTRDIDDSYVVGFGDFAYLAKYWQVADCGGDPNCHKIDFNDSNKIDLFDLMEFADYWLEKTR